MNFINAHGRAVPQAVSFRPITAGDEFHPRLVRVKFVVDKATLGQDYLRVHPCFLFSITSQILLTRLHLNTTPSRTTGDVSTGGNLREIDHLEDLGVDRKVKLKWIFMERDGDMDWIYLA
jgi:hypothetical protein